MRNKVFNKDLDIRAYRRMVIVRLHKRSMSQEAISEVVGCSQGLVSQVLAAYREEGEAGIASQPHPGAQARLSCSQKERLKKNTD